MTSKDIAKISQLTDCALEVVTSHLCIGTATVDFVCRDQDSGDIVVLKQIDILSSSNLGEVFLCAAETDAKTIILVSENTTPEQFRMVDKLTQITDFTFYLVKCLISIHTRLC